MRHGTYALYLQMVDLQYRPGYHLPSEHPTVHLKWSLLEDRILRYKEKMLLQVNLCSPKCNQI